MLMKITELEHIGELSSFPSLRYEIYQCGGSISPDAFGKVLLLYYIWQHLKIVSTVKLAYLWILG